MHTNAFSVESELVLMLDFDWVSHSSKIGSSLVLGLDSLPLNRIKFGLGLRFSTLNITSIVHVAPSPIS